MSPQRLTQLFEAIHHVRVGVIGDYCLDAYWTLDPAGSEISIETGKRTHAVRHQRYELGGAGNVVSNLVALGVGAGLAGPAIHAFAVVGDDLFGRELTARLTALGVDAAGICVQRAAWDTPVYGKPYMGDEEQSRLDFGAFNQIAPASEEQLHARLAAALAAPGAARPRGPDAATAHSPETAARAPLQVVIVNQQLAQGINSPGMIARLNRLIASHPECIFIVDSRHGSDRFTGAILKVNAAEAARLAGAAPPTAPCVTLAALQTYAAALHRRTHQPVIITRGEHGLLAFDGRASTAVPGIPIAGPVDPVGAGDTAVAAIAAALAVRATIAEAAELANLAAAVTVQKLKQCGTATPAEVLALAGRHRAPTAGVAEPTPLRCHSERSAAE